MLYLNSDIERVINGKVELMKKGLHRKMTLGKTADGKIYLESKIDASLYMLLHMGVSNTATCNGKLSVLKGYDKYVTILEKSKGKSIREKDRVVLEVANTRFCILRISIERRLKSLSDFYIYTNDKVIHTNLLNLSRALAHIGLVQQFTVNEDGTLNENEWIKL